MLGELGMITKIKRRIKHRIKKILRKVERQKHWEVCEGNCASCWPKVYAACSSKKKVSRILLIMEEQIDKQEEGFDLGRFFTAVIQKGFIEIL
jgi:hypothetical protein